MVAVSLALLKLAFLAEKERPYLQSKEAKEAKRSYLGLKVEALNKTHQLN